MDVESILNQNEARRARLGGVRVPNTDAIEPGDVIELNGRFWLADKWYVTGWNFYPMNEHGMDIVGSVQFFRHGEILAGHAMFAEVHND